MKPLTGLALCLSLLVSGCATYGRIVNQPLPAGTPAEAGYGMRQLPAVARRDDVTLVLAFSGGGSRAAALAYGVLLELRDTRIGVDGARRLLDEVDAISAVSGGSFTAAYYGLHGDATFRDFESVFLRRNLTGDVLHRILSPARWFSSEGRSTAAAALYDSTIFGGATFADLQRREGPLIVINASDLEGGTRFAFLQEFFDLLCSDLSSYPVADAVAASSAVPVLFEPMVLENHAGCTAPTLAPAGDDVPELQLVNEGLRAYADKHRRHYIHLADGGLTDNLGLRAFQETVDLAGGARRFLDKLGRTPSPRFAVLSVDASANAAAGLGLDARAPSLARAIDVMTDVQLHRYNAATLQQMHESMQRWSRELSTTGAEVQPRLLTVALSDVADADERERLARVPTSFNLAPGQVDELVAAGRALLRGNPGFQDLLAELAAAAP